VPPVAPVPANVSLPSLEASAVARAAATPPPPPPPLTPSDVPADGWVPAAAMLTLALGFLAVACATGYNLNFVDLSPRHSQLIYAISNSLASLPGVAASALGGEVLQITHQNWALIFRCCAAILTIGAVAFACCSSAEEQDFETVARSGCCAVVPSAQVAADCSVGGPGHEGHRQGEEVLGSTDASTTRSLNAKLLS
jgi:hypothetical protein